MGENEIVTEGMRKGRNRFHYLHNIRVNCIIQQVRCEGVVSNSRQNGLE